MFEPRRIQHCRVCGARAEYRVPPADNRERAICTACGEIHYENPINVVGTVPVWGDQVLLCRRNIEPRHGMWTLPAGFLECGESTADGRIYLKPEEECLAACCGAPMMMVDHKYYENLTTELVDRVLDELE